MEDYFIVNLYILKRNNYISREGAIILAFQGL